MFVVGANKKMRAQAKATANFMTKRVGALAGGTLIECVFGIDFLPVETLMVLYLYRLVLQERKETAEAARERQTGQASYAFG